MRLAHDFLNTRAMAAAAISIAVRRNYDSNEDEESPTLLPGRSVKEEDQDLIERMLGSPSVSEGGESLASIGAISRQQPGVFRGGAPVLGSFRSLGSMDSTRDPLLPVRGGTITHTTIVGWQQ